MPYLKIKQGNKWCIYKEVNGKRKGPTLGCHPTEKDANSQLSALNINVQEKEIADSIANEILENAEVMMKKKEDSNVEVAEDEEEVREYYPSYEFMNRSDVPYGARSFADVAAAREARQLMELLEGHTSVFYSLFWRIWRDADIPIGEKPAAWRGLLDEFISAFEEEVSEDESLMNELDEFSELEGSIVRISESDKSNADNRAPLKMDIKVIEPGWGNPKDKHYYPAEMLRRDAHIFEGAKMYATDHRPEEKNVRTEVAKVERIIGFSESGAPIARTKVWNPDFAEDIRNRDKLGELDSLKCSILAKGKARKGKIDDQDANIVEQIIASKFTNVDFVTNAGAGGHALALVESEKEVDMTEKAEAKDQETTEDLVDAEEVLLNEDEETQDTEEKEEETETEEIENAEDETEDVETGETYAAEGDDDEPTFLAESAVSDILENSELPEISVNRLALNKYSSESDLQKIVAAEKDYIKQLVGTGQVRGLGKTEPVTENLSVSELIEDHKKRIDAIIHPNRKSFQ